MIERSRLQELNDEPEREGEYVLYWMQQSQCEDFNLAFEATVAGGNRLGLPTLVGFGLIDIYPEASARQYAFMLEGLRDDEAALSRRGIGFVIQRGSPDEVAIELARGRRSSSATRYLGHQKEWRRNVAENAGRRVLQIEGDVVVPAGLASDKMETRRERCAKD